MDELHDAARGLLIRLTGRPDADFHEGQWEAINALVRDHRRALVVQRTGWGKSAVYFIATRLLRDQGAGPTILLSPLLALMRNQIEAAQRMGVRAETINSDNQDNWSAVIEELRAGQVDLLVISPERLANKRFREEVLREVGPSAGLVVIDEAHCISDWGHDFRPDYRRIRVVLDLLPTNVPVLACTATANDRVIADIEAQLGSDLLVQRGPLARDGLGLHVIELPSQADRLAWLAQAIPAFEGTGIVYCLTKRDVATVTSWLNSNGVTARAYMSGSDDRVGVEQALLANEVKVVVATSALGMGFDKPDLGFVIHYQSPGSPIAYYQQVGRAGRQLDNSLGVLLRGTEDREIQDWFISRAFPTLREVTEALGVLEAADDFVRLSELESLVNVRQSRLEVLLKNLEVDGVIIAEGRKYQRTARRWAYDQDRVDAITALRRAEQQQMIAFGDDDLDCRMSFIQRTLDDPAPSPCGRCDRCLGHALAIDVDPDLTRRARRFVRGRPATIEPRKRWPDNKAIPVDRRVEVGRALGTWRDAGWGDLIREGKQVDSRFDDELVNALARLVTEWSPDPGPTWLTFVPSRRTPTLVPDLAGRVGAALGLPVHEVVAKVADRQPQKTMENSTRQLENVSGAFEVRAPLPDGPVILLDDIIDSKWTITEIGRLLRAAGCPAVHPLALADAGAS